MICVNCGKEVRDGAKFCTFCGTPIAAPAPEAESAPITESAPEPVPVTESAAESAPVTESAPEPAPVTESAPVTEPTPAPAPVQSAPAPTPAPVQPAPIPTPIPVQPAPMPAQPVGMVPPAAGGQKKKSHAGLIVLIIVIIVLILLLAGGGLLAFLFLNRPIHKINKALEAGDMERVVELYGDLSGDEDKEAVSEELLSYAKKVRDDYLKEKNGMDYATAIEILNMLAGASLETDDEIEDIRTLVNDINESREAFAAAEAYRADGDYEAALEEYAKVISDDTSYYDKAQEAIEETEQELQDAIAEAGKALVGTWELKCDMADIMHDELGSDFEDFESSLEMTILIDFNEDGTFKLYVDESSFVESFNGWLDDFIAYGVEVLYEMFEEDNGMSREEVDGYIMDSFGMSMEELMREMFASELDVDLLVSEMKTTGTYETRYDRLYLIEKYDVLDEDEYNIFSVSGNKLTLELPEGADEEDYEILPELSYPLTFQKR